ncbi:cytochrome c-type biogenesis protein CcmH [bacterium]|nr:cytochrome c-type biogenesis protein CcmH [bacterium]
MKTILIVLFFSAVLATPSSGSCTPPSGLIDDQFSRHQMNTFHEVQGNIMSPYCPGRLLKDCPSSAARELKLSIKERILQGEDAETIIQSLLEDFGNEMRASPKGEGVGLLAWLAPAAFLLLGFGGLLLWVKGQSESPPSR